MSCKGSGGDMTILAMEKERARRNQSRDESAVEFAGVKTLGVVQHVTECSVSVGYINPDELWGAGGVASPVSAVSLALEYAILSHRCPIGRVGDSWSLVTSRSCTQ